MCKKKMLLMEGIQLQIELSSGKTARLYVFLINFFIQIPIFLSVQPSGLINIMMLTLQNLFFDFLNVKQNKSE